MVLFIMIVIIRKMLIYSKWVILTCSGFGNDFENDSLLKEFVPHLMNFITKNCQIKGIGMKMQGKLMFNYLIWIKYKYFLLLL